MKRWEERAKAAIFFMYFALCNARHKVIENPVGFMNTAYRKPDQIIHPYMFVNSPEDSEYVTKATCLWLEKLPPLVTNNLPKPNNREIYGTLPSGKAKTWEDSLCRSGGAAKIRSKTFNGVANAIAEQYGRILLDE